MPKGPRGEKRPGDVIGAAIMVAKIATGEVEDKTADAEARKAAIAETRAVAGKRGGTARAASMNPKRRTEIAKKGAATRWKRDAQSTD